MQTSTNPPACHRRPIHRFLTLTPDAIGIYDDRMDAVRAIEPLRRTHPERWAAYKVLALDGQGNHVAVLRRHDGYVHVTACQTRELAQGWLEIMVDLLDEDGILVQGDEDAIGEHVYRGRVITCATAN